MRVSCIIQQSNFTSVSVSYVFSVSVAYTGSFVNKLCTYFSHSWNVQAAKCARWCWPDSSPHSLRSWCGSPAAYLGKSEWMRWGRQRTPWGRYYEIFVIFFQFSTGNRQWRALVMCIPVECWICMFVVLRPLLTERCGFDELELNRMCNILTLFNIIY